MYIHIYIYACVCVCRVDVALIKHGDSERKKKLVEKIEPVRCIVLYTVYIDGSSIHLIDRGTRFFWSCVLSQLIAVIWYFYLLIVVVGLFLIAVQLLDQQHWVLVTLLVVNSACMEALPIFLDRLFNPYAAIIISVTAILLFGEIIPQAVCKRYGLQVGAYLHWLVWGMMWTTSPISWPIAKLLDIVIGHSHLLFRRQEIDHIVQAHKEGHFIERGDSLGVKITEQEAELIHGTLKLHTKHVGDAMTPMKDVFMISSTEIYSEKLELDIIESGRSRIPVKLEDGSFKLILVKELLLLPKTIFQQKKRIKDIPEITGLMRRIDFVHKNAKMFEVLGDMMEKRKHLALVIDQDDGGSDVQTDTILQIDEEPQGSKRNAEEIEQPLLETRHQVEEATSAVPGPIHILGIVTLEDIIEEIMTKEILDETDRPAPGGGRDLQFQLKQNMISKRRKRSDSNPAKQPRHPPSRKRDRILQRKRKQNKPA